MPELLGRTNRAFPSVWLRMGVPESSTHLPEFIEAAIASNVPLDISSQPALWGGSMRGTAATVVVRSRLEYSRANDETHATDLVQAHLIETLSCIGREHLDFYFLRVRSSVEEYQIGGALQAMELARQEGHIRYLGIACDGSSLATLGTWQFHDAFDVLLVPPPSEEDDAYDTLAPLARERRVGVVTDGTAIGPNGEPRLVSVRSASEVRALIADSGLEGLKGEKQ